MGVPGVETCPVTTVEVRHVVRHDGPQLFDVVRPRARAARGRPCRVGARDGRLGRRRRRDHETATGRPTSGPPANAPTRPCVGLSWNGMPGCSAILSPSSMSRTASDDGFSWVRAAAWSSRSLTGSRTADWLAASCSRWQLNRSFPSSRPPPAAPSRSEAHKIVNRDAQAMSSDLPSGNPRRQTGASRRSPLT